MKLRKKHTWWIPALIVTSGGLLIAFLVSWLLTQYHAAGKRIEKDVRADLRKTSEQMVDSLMIHFFSISSSYPITTSANISITDPEMTEQTISHNSTEIQILVKDDSSGQQHITRDFIRKLPPPEIRRIERKPLRGKRVLLTNTDKELLEDSVLTQLFTEGAGAMAKQLSTYQKTSNILSITNQQLDTSLCRKLLRKNWQNKDLKYALVFRDKSKDSSVIYPGNPLFGNLFGVRLENKSKIAFSAILPEFSFALLLLIITIVSFVLVYRSYLRQVQINVMRTDFVNNISHELKTPVSTVRVALDALQHYDRKNDPQVRDEYLQMMSQEVDRLDRLIHQVLQHGRMESAENLLQLAPVDLGALTEAVVEHYRFKSEGKGATILLHKPPHSITLMLDKEHFKGVLGNLIENALLYAGDAPEIVVTLQQNDRHILLEVQDNGPGIDPQYLSQLFQPFFRVPKGNTHNVKGYGLGLSYCKQIVEQHKGTLSVTNRTTGGCVFLITLNR